jgi:hypothetical protein
MLAAQLKEAHTMKRRHKELLEEFSAEFPPDVISQWVETIIAWNMDPSSTNPYEEVENGEMYC